MKPRCLGTNRRGSPCARIPAPGESLCVAHQRSEVEDGIKWLRELLPRIDREDDEIVVLLMTTAFDHARLRGKFLATLEAIAADESISEIDERPIEHRLPMVESQPKAVAPPPDDEDIEFVDEESE